MNNVFFPVLTAIVPCPFLKYVPAFVIPNLASAGHSILNQLLFLSNNLSVSGLKSHILVFLHPSLSSRLLGVPQFDLYIVVHFIFLIFFLNRIGGQMQS